MLVHPGIEIQDIIREKGLTQKAFSILLGKKVSEVNELLKGKRNITIQRDYALHKALGTPIKYWILKQVDYDYSLLNIKTEPDLSPVFIQETTISKDNNTTQETEDKTINTIEDINQSSESTLTTTDVQKTEKNQEYYERANIFKGF